MTRTVDDLASPPTRIGQRYQVVRALGHGGMASVYEVVDELSGKRLAIKQLHARHVAGDGLMARLFEREFHTLTQLAHPRVVAVYDYQNQDDGAFYTMELLDGDDLREQRALPWRVVCALLCDVCSALSLLHSRRFVHRDVTPRNIRRTRDGKAKLIDFGAMVPFGTHKHTVGTPAFTAPEAANGQPLDGRADLYSLGATAYYALTGQHAYPARMFANLRNAWRTQPAVPSRYVSDIPPDLDQLVMALLSLSPARRPASAAAVIERLTAIAGLQIEEQLLVQRSFLSTPSLVGRDSLLTQVRRQMIQASRGRGSAVFLTGPRGVGRSRMVDACALEAKLASGAVLRADAGDAQDGEWGGVRSLLEQLLTELPAKANKLIAQHAGLISHVWPRATEITGVQPQTIARTQAVRPAVQGALIALMEDVAREVLLVIAVDDLDRLDEPTQAFVTLFAQQVSGRRSVVVASAPNETIDSKPSAGLSLLRRAESTITLEALSLADSERLLISMFGDAPNVRMLASRLYEVAEGLPAATLQFTQYLLDHDVIVFRDGGWLLPSNIDRDALPNNLTDALRERVTNFDAASRELAQAFTLSGESSLTQDQCRQLMAAAEQPKVLRALDALIAADVVRAQGECYGLQPVWEKLLVAELDPDLKRILHARVAAMFRQESQSAFRAVGHLLACGEGDAAVDLQIVYVEQATKLLNEDPARLPEHIRAQPSDWMETLEAGIICAEQLGRPLRQRLTLQLALLQRLSVATEPRVDLARAVVKQLHADSGLRDYEELADAVRAEDRLARAFALTQARYESTPEAARGWTIGEAIPLLSRLYVQLLGMVGVSADGAFLQALPSLAPLAGLSPAIAMVQRNIECTIHMFAGRVEQAHAGNLEILASMDAPEGIGLTPAIHHYMKLAVTYSTASFETMGGRASAAQRIDLLERDPLFEVNAWRLRMLWSLRQGNVEAAELCERKAELLRIRNAPTQLFEGTDVWWEALAYAAIGDVARLRLGLLRLENLGERFPALRFAPFYVRGKIQLLRGEAADAAEIFGQALAHSLAGEVSSWALNARGYLMALAACDRVAEARARGAVLLTEARAAGLTVYLAHLHFAMATVELAGADHQAALSQLHAVETICKRWPLGDVFVGACHELRAQIAIAMRDGTAFEKAVRQCAELFLRSRNAILIGRHQRLLQDAERVGLRASAAARAAERGAGDDDDATLVTAHKGRKSGLSLGDCDGFEARVSKVMSLVTEHGSGRHLMLYLVRDRLPVLVGETPNCPAAQRTGALVAEFLAGELDQNDGSVIDPDDLMTTTVDNSAWTGKSGVQFAPALLSHALDGGIAVTGVLVFDVAGHHHPSDELLADLSQALTEAGDVVPIAVQASARFMPTTLRRAFG